MNPAWKTCLGTAGMLVFPLLTGCGGSSSNTSAPTLTPRSVSTTLSNGLMGTLTEQQTTVAKGAAVTYTLTVTNPTAQPITFWVQTPGPTSSIGLGGAVSMTDPTGAVNAYPVGFPVSQAVGFASTTLAPGKSISGTEVIGSSAAFSFSLAGQYTATATFTALPGPESPTPGGPQITAATGPLPITVQ